jgi:hypothetical protein
MVERHQSDSEFSILKVEESYRIRLPQPLLRHLGWVTGDKPVSGWLLLANPGRCRLLSASEVEEDPGLKSLLARIAVESSVALTSALEFHDEVSVALATRLMPVQITPPDPGWRLTLPRPIAAIMRVRPKESELAARFIQSHIELWTIEMLRSAVAHPFLEVL